MKYKFNIDVKVDRYSTMEMVVIIDAGNRKAAKEMLELMLNRDIKHYTIGAI